MQRFIAGALVLLATCWVSSAWASGWSVTLDVPLTYEFGDIHAVKYGASSGNNGGGSQPLWKDVHTSDVSGAIVTLVTPLHIGPVNFGLGYENYEVKNTLIANSGNNNGSPFDVTIDSKFEIFDLVLDLPTELFNIDFGYGVGSAATTLAAPAAQVNGSLPTIPTAGLTQYFLTLGVPFKRFDVHFGWHYVNVDEVNLNFGAGGNNGPPQHILLSGQLFTLGARYNF